MNTIETKAQHGAAYDYTAQRWVSGGVANGLRAQQLREELATLESARGSEYLAFLGMTISLPLAIARCKQQLSAVEMAVGK